MKFSSSAKDKRIVSTSHLWLREALQQRLAMIYRHSIRYFVVALCVTILSAQMSDVLAQQQDLELLPCELPSPLGGRAVKAECGRLKVAENPQQPDGRQISLRIAKVPARAAKALPDPVFLFAGGPGQAATEAYPIVAHVFHEINDQRDIVLIDQRGTGGSNRLQCPFDLEDLTQAVDLDKVRQSTKECLQQLDADPRFYTTSIAMQDYEKVRQALGYDSINLWGGSYGTRSAQVYQRMYPERVRTMVLDSVAPPRLALGAEHASQLDRVLEQLMQRCADDEACASAFPQLMQRFTGLVRDVTDNPQLVQLADPKTGEKVDLLADRNSLAVGLRFMAYGSPNQSLIPLMIHQAAEGDLLPLLSATYNTISGLEDQLARGMELSVVCAEDEPFIGDISSEENTLIGLIMVQSMRASCEEWPRGDVPDDFHQAKASDIPTLLLSGELDPVTPPAYAYETAEQFSQHRVIEVKGRGHLVSHHGCIPSLLAEFYDSAIPTDLDIACVERIGPEPFFLSRTGPNP